MFDVTREMVVDKIYNKRNYEHQFEAIDLHSQYKVEGSIKLADELVLRRQFMEVKGLKKLPESIKIVTGRGDEKVLRGAIDEVRFKN